VCRPLAAQIRPRVRQQPTVPESAVNDATHAKPQAAELRISTNPNSVSLRGHTGAAARKALSRRRTPTRPRRRWVPASRSIAPRQDRPNLPTSSAPCRGRSTVARPRSPNHPRTTAPCTRARPGRRRTDSSPPSPPSPPRAAPPGVRPAAAAAAAATAGADTDTGTDEVPAPQAAAPQPAATPQAATISSALHRIVRWRNGSRHAPLHEPRA
jgi:hypothetical protein